MMIIHVLVDTSQVESQDEDITGELVILYDQQQIYLHLVLQNHDQLKHLIQAFKLH